MGEPDFTPEIVILHCKQSVAESKRLPSVARESGRSGLQFRLIPCGGKIQLPHLLRMLEAGDDGVVVFACPEKDCRTLEGSSRVQRRIEYARELLDQAGVGAGRLALVRGKEMGAEEALKQVDEFAGAVLKLGPNPVKGVGVK
jgi:coenzyme F420-reducing hydrogenase delta subunit